MSVEVINETDVEIGIEEFRDIAEYVLAQMHVSPDADLSILFIDPEPMEELHIKWLDLPGPTDVMSFPMDELRPGQPGQVTPPGILGDIVICPQVAHKQALEAGHSSVEEMLLLTVHGMLHLLGYDHAEEEEKRVMFTLQRQLLLTFFANHPLERADG
ncbi:MAG: rRNA maturation RNase YbeY [Actinomycetaceae bacterium]|nr:rRNA maturation RNase YbeY [Actinomycetaceae bacterium]